jgi:hypothetical protein
MLGSLPARVSNRWMAGFDSAGKPTWDNTCHKLADHDGWTVLRLSLTTLAV